MVELAGAGNMSANYANEILEFGTKLAKVIRVINSFSYMFILNCVIVCRVLIFNVYLYKRYIYYYKYLKTQLALEITYLMSIVINWTLIINLRN